MFGFGKKAPKPEKPQEKQREQAPVPPLEQQLEQEQTVPAESAVVVNAPVAEKGPSWFSRVRQGLSRTRSSFADGLSSLILGSREIDDDLFEEIETQLLMADLGVETTMMVMKELTQAVDRKSLKDSGALYQKLQQILTDLLIPVSQPLDIPKQDSPFVILVVGVNGAGKTTSIGKLAHYYKKQGLSVMLAAGDTFRAAAVEQLQVWGERNQIPVIAQHTGADSASVIYDAVAAAKARKVDVLIADTAGRLQNKGHLMAELEKVVRVMQKLDPNAPHETLLVLDAGTGQNAISQMTEFSKTVPVTGLALTKLDGTAKGGVIFALARQMNRPIRFIGVGEGIDDMQPFSADEFTKALFSGETE